MLERMRRRLAEILAARREMVETCERADGGPRDMTEDEWTRFRELGTEETEVRGRITELEGEEQRRTEGDENRRDAGGQGGARVTNEADLYRPDAEHGFLSDLFRSQEMGDWTARERLQRHGAVEAERRQREGRPQSRAVGTGNLAGLSPPQYLVDLYAPLAREGRVLADLATPMQLPANGMTLVIPRQVAGTTVAPQVNENTNLVEQDIDNVDLVVPVRTIGGGTTVSRQSLERNDAGVDELVFADLAAEYSLEINEQVAVGTETLGTMKGLLFSGSSVSTFTYTSASPSPVEFWRRLAGAIAAHRRNRKLAADVIVMTPERWAWLSTGVDENGRPLVVPSAQNPQNSIGTSEGGLANLRGYVGTVHSLPVHVDPTLPINRGAGSNQDPVILGRRGDWHLWEEGDGVPRQLRFEQPLGRQLSVQLFVYGYAAFTAERYPAGTTVIDGTGLVQPTL
ncbi:phage major capsid protein [Pseudonocardia alni]|uniref:phage major capsid protein n=1 Tax=Pseudonocardia alni TaxID=33907 RepID=UPI0027997932|nr:phage major capsid protein [Pseudonocardia alni]WFG47481.1 phage major capsid protein [Pseudonocardia alni]